MSAPPSHMPLLFTSGTSYLANSSYLAPASTFASDSRFTWDPMPPRQEPIAQPQRINPKSPTEPANEEPPSDGGLIFITGSTPADFKSKTTMTTVRKKAMDAFLKGDKKDKKSSRKSKSSASRSRFSSIDSDSRASNRSKLSVGSQDAATDFLTVPTTSSHRTESVGRTMASSPTRSSVPSSHGQDVPSVETSVARIQKPRDFVLPAAPIFLPCRRNVPLPYDSYVPPPFVSIGRSIDPFRTMFQSSHPGVSVEQLKYHCSAYFGTRALGRYWIPTALSYPHTFLGTLCLATAYHDVIHEEPLESLQTIALRQEVIHLVGRNMLNPQDSVSDHNIMAVIQLIISEVIGREESGLKYHEDGIENMIKQRGGMNQLGINGRLASAVAWVSLATAVLREEAPRTMYADYCAANSTKHYQLTATVPESPIYCPRPSFRTIMRSSGCTQKAQELLSEIRTMIDVFLHETKQSRRNSLTLTNIYKRIISSREYPPISEIAKIQILTKHDYKYEAIRIASVIQATAIMKRLPLSEALSVAAEPQNSLSIYTSSAAYKSSESLISPFDVSQETPITESTSPSFTISPAVPQSFFPTVHTRSSFSSASSVNPHRPSSSSTFSAPRPSISSMHSTSSDHVYFAPPPAPKPNHTTSLLRSLKDAIENSDISACWGDMAGVLLWVGLVVGAASKSNESKVLKKYYSALTMRAGVLLCFEHPEGINNTMLRMGEVIEALSSEKKRNEDSEGRGKKRRM